MGTPVNIIEGSHVWVGDPLLAWVDGQVLNITGEVAEILTNEGEMVISNISDLYPKDMEAPPGGVDDMTKLSYLHEPGVLQNLATRYELNQIYTYTGDILIAINPFQGLSHLYDSHVMEHYKGAQFGKLSPHVFAIADVAYRDMIEEGQSNSILVSGESGAGKTETTKMIMQYLAYLGGHEFTGRRTVERQVLESNPVLEAFGNAKTVRNNNSSRFGKFVEIQFDKQGRISGAAIRTYLLERSRVCQISEAERNYHCFYLLCAAPPEEIETYKLGDPKSFHYLNQSNCYDRSGASDAHDYLATRRAMDIVGISKSEQDAIFRVVAAILHLGNIDFATDGDFDSSVVNDESWLHLYMAAELLMCDPYALQDGLCKRVMITPEEVIRRSLDPIGAIVNRDGLAKTIYSRLFDWLVEKINMSIGQDPNSKSSIGVLDIYGFESFETNSFEQFCINYTNEKLQQHFNQHVFKMEQEEYIKDEINWSYIDFVDNKDVLSLIDKKPGGIISLLDEACMFPKSTAETFSQKLYQTFKDHKRFIKPKLARTGFTVAHYAGEVEYQSDQFLDKNKDYVVPEHQDLLSASKCDFVASLFPPLLEETTKTSKFSSIGSRFKLQLHQLLDTLNSTEPHYVRCVKPNNHLKPSIFENINVLQQLRSGGVLEAIRISCAGYPTRRSFSEFLYRFGMLAPEVLEKGYDEKVACKRILDKFGLTGCQIGKTKIFLRSGQMAELDARRALARNNAAHAIQRHVRTQISRKEFIATRKASIHLQALWRRKMAWILYKDMSRTVAAVKIQKKMRRYLAIKDYERLKFSSLILQTGLRTMAACNELNYRKTIKAATFIQASWRGHRDSSDYKKFKTASKITQCRWRGRMAQKKLETDLRTTAAYNELNYRKTNEAATLIQASWRGHRDFSYYKKFKAASKITQLRWRGKTARKEHKKIETDLRTTAAYNELNYRKTNEAATLIQASWRGHRDFSYYKKFKAASKITQFRWRGKIARMEHKKIEDVTGTEAKNYIKMMEQDNQLRAHLDEIKEQDNKELDYSFQARQNNVHDTLFVKKHQVAYKASDASAPIVTFPQVHLQEYKRIELLTSEVETLKALLQSEKQRSDAMEKRYLETLVRSERREKKLEETGRRVHQLQEYLNRMMYCMSNQVADLKMVVHASLSSSSSSSSSTESMAKYDPVESICTSSSDATSTSSDFTFPAPSPSQETFSTVSDAFQLVVHDLSAPEISEYDKWGPDREQGFEDFF